MLNNIKNELLTQTDSLSFFVVYVIHHKSDFLVI